MGVVAAVPFLFTSFSHQFVARSQLDTFEQSFYILYTHKSDLSSVWAIQIAQKIKVLLFVELKWKEISGSLEYEMKMCKKHLNKKHTTAPEATQLQSLKIIFSRLSWRWPRPIVACSTKNNKKPILTQPKWLSSAPDSNLSFTLSLEGAITWQWTIKL